MNKSSLQRGSDMSLRGFIDNINLFSQCGSSAARFARRRNFFLLGAGLLSAIGAGTVAFIRYRRQQQQESYVPVQ
jgi:hypothetical protein